MPNFAYTNQTNFRPFSYQEMLAPVLAATQAHQAIEEAYSELDSQANAIGSLASETNDPETYRRYKAYESALRTQADALAKNGLTPGSRKTLLDLRGRYSKDIIPIQNAITRRRALADEQRKALLQNPTLMFQRDMNSLSYDSSLDRFLENADYDYGEVYSGNLLTQQVSQAASNLAKELSRTSVGRLDDYTKTFLQHHGFTREQVLDAINNPNRAKSQPVLNAIVEQVIGASGMSGWADDVTMKDAYNYARLGLWSSIGQTNISTFDDYGARMELQDYYKNKNTGNTPEGGFALNLSNIYSSRELSKEEKKYNKNVEDFKDYFYKENGKWKMKHKGWEEYNKKYRYIKGNTATTPEGTVVLTEAEPAYADSPFKKFVDSLGAKGISSKSFGPWQSSTVGDLWGKYVENSPSAKTARYDAMKATESIYDVPQTDSYQQNFKAKVRRAIGSGEKLIEVDFNPKTNTWEDTGNRLDLSDFDSDDYALIARAPSEFKTTWFIGKKGEKAKRYMAIPGIHTTAEAGRDTAIQEAIATRRMLQNKNLTEEQRAKLNSYYDRLTQQIHMFESQVDLTNKPVDQEHKPYYIP